MDVKLPSLGSYRPLKFDDLIRVGKAFDGGYVMPSRALEASRSVLSLGVNDDWSFEEAVLKRRPAARIVCVDGTVSFAKILKRTLEKAGNLLGYLLLFKWQEVRRTAHYVATKAVSYRRFFGSTSCANSWCPRPSRRAMYRSRHCWRAIQPPSVRCS